MAVGLSRTKFKSWPSIKRMTILSQLFVWEGKARFLLCFSSRGCCSILIHADPGWGWGCHILLCWQSVDHWLWSGPVWDAGCPYYPHQHQLFTQALSADHCLPNLCTTVTQISLLHLYIYTNVSSTTLIYLNHCQAYAFLLPNYVDFYHPFIF